MNWSSVQKYRKDIVKDLREALERGVAPWQKPWSEVEDGMPRNALTGHFYSGNNACRLYLKQQLMHYTDPRWLTYRQAQGVKWDIKTKLGEVGTYIWVCVDADRKQYIPHVVFNAQQFDGLTCLKPYVPKVEKRAPVEKRCDKAERILRESGARILYGGNRAYYSPLDDYIKMPMLRSFDTSADYYATVLHELAHWTGHETRLNRDLSGCYGTKSYAFEELVAEISSMFVSAETGIDQTKEHFDNHASYVNSWLEVIGKDDEVLFGAVGLAHEAAEEILKHERKRESKNISETSYLLRYWDPSSIF